MSVDPETYRKSAWVFPASIVFLLVCGSFAVGMIDDLPPADREVGRRLALAAVVVGALSGYLLYRFAVRGARRGPKYGNAFGKSLIWPAAALALLVEGLLEIAVLAFCSGAGVVSMTAFWVWAAREARGGDP